MIHKKLLLVKSDNFTPQQLDQLTSKGIQTTHLNLLQFEYNQIKGIDDQYDYILFHSVNGVEAYIRNNCQCNTKKFMVVGQKTKEKVQSNLENASILTFNNQNELTQHLLEQKQNFKLLYIIGNLSQIGEELKNKHTVTIIVGYITIPVKDNQQQLDFNTYDYIVYYSNSNYVQFKQIAGNLKENIKNIFIGQKCSQGHTETNFTILPVPSFEALLECL